MLDDNIVKNENMLTKYRYAIQFSKFGALKFVGHLDFMRAFGRAIRRGGLPIAYSQGFNPHMQLSFALPLPLGMESEKDYGEIWLTEDIGECALLEILNSHKPPGLMFLAARKMEETEPRYASVTTAADYIAYNEPGLINPEAISAILNENTLIALKKTKSGYTETNIRPDIINLSYQDSPKPRIYMRLSAGSTKFLNPQLLLEEICKRMAAKTEKHKWLISRQELFKEINHKLIAFSNANWVLYQL